MIRSPQAEEEALASSAKPVRYVWFVHCFTLSIWQVHIQTDQQNMTGSLLKHTAQSPSCACSVQLPSGSPVNAYHLALNLC